MVDKSNPVDTGPVEGRNVVEHEYSGALLVNEFACASWMKNRDVPETLCDGVKKRVFEEVMEVEV